MKLGIGSYATMWAIGFEFGGRAASPERPMSAFDLLRRTHELGLHVVQYGPNLPLAALSEAELALLARQAAAWGVELELGTRGLEPDHLREQIALAHRLGARLLRTVPEIGGVTAAAHEIPACLQPILPAAEVAGVRVGLENGELPALALKAALDAVGSPWLGVVLDTVNSFAVAEGWRYVTEILAPHTVCLHYKDFVVRRVWHRMGFVVEGRPAGQGQLDTSWLLRTLDAAGAHYNVILELWPPEQTTLADTVALESRWIAESIAYLRQYIPQ